MATNYNEDEIKRFAARLETLADEASITCDIIDNNLRKICSIMYKYRKLPAGTYSSLEQRKQDYMPIWKRVRGDAALDLGEACNSYADQWLTFTSTWSSLCVKLAANMLGFYDATAANQGLTREQEQELMKQFEQFYSENPQYKNGEHKYVWAKGKTMQELIDDHFVDETRPRNFDNRDSSVRVNVDTSAPKTELEKGLYENLMRKLEGDPDLRK